MHIPDHMPDPPQPGDADFHGHRYLAPVGAGVVLGLMSMYHSCGNRACSRIVREPAIFCCVPCVEASQRGGEPGTHTEVCDSLAAGRPVSVSLAREWCIPGCDRLDGHDGRDTGACMRNGEVLEASDYNGNPLSAGCRVRGWLGTIQYTATVKEIKPYHPGCGPHRHIVLIRDGDQAEIKSSSDAVQVR